MSKTNGIEIFLGCAPIGGSMDPTSRYTTAEAAREYLDAFQARGYGILDTARMYPTDAQGTTEQLMGEANAAKDFVIDSKVRSFAPGAHKAEDVTKSVEESLAALKSSKVNVMYLHAPDRDTPFKETCKAINKLFEAGKFNTFGLSNYTADEVEKIVDICITHGWVKPAVYQGQYNALMRNAEQLFPTLRKHGIQFVAYSPAAGGFFSGLKYARPGSRFAPVTMMGNNYNSMFGKEELKKLAANVVTKAQEEGLTGHAAVLRWIIHHSQLQKGDAVVIAASSIAQLNDNINALEAGPLPPPLVEEFDELWKKARALVSPYHF